MYYFINCLRALAATLITNAHYTNVYPISIIANGGLLGDILFFAVSGFCLYNIKLKFIPWYKKRISRIYPSVIIVTGVYILMKFYTYNGIKGLFNLLIYPTKYHFVISIMILYIFYYFTIILSRKNENITIDRVFFMTIIIQFIVYVVIYDKSYYHIDSVYEPMIRFLFFEAMLIGAKFNELTHDLVQRSIEPMKKALSDAGLSISQIDKVILVGGSTRLPAVQEAVKNFKGKEPSKGVNPDE